MEVYNNTLFHCGTFAKPPYDGSRAAVMNGGHNDKLIIRMRNNIVVQPAGIPYLVGANHAIIGANNLFFGNGAVSSNFRFTGTIAKDPQLMNLTQLDFHLSATSPAKGAGVDAGQGMDLGALPFITPVPAVP